MVTHEQLADALDTFWNASLGATHSHQDSTANAVMHGIVEGIAAVSQRLREYGANNAAEAYIAASKQYSGG